LRFKQIKGMNLQSHPIRKRKQPLQNKSMNF
jgi:hypothetical protein